MSKADELLKHLYFQFTDTSFAGKNYKEFKRRTLSNELVEDIENYLNRKDKLVVGSEWVCDVGCIGSKMSYNPYDDETVFVVDVRDFVTFTYFLYDNAHEDDMPLEQFLVCFSPKEKE